MPVLKRNQIGEYKFPVFEISCIISQFGKQGASWSDAMKQEGKPYLPLPPSIKHIDTVITTSNPLEPRRYIKPWIERYSNRSLG